MEDALRQAVEAAALRPEVADAARAVYDGVAAEIDRRRPACAVSGRCCHFEAYGHRLFVTTIELAAFLGAYGGGAVASWTGAGCPFQAGKLCGVHAIRPFGCRMFFCDPTSTDWQNAAYERFHAELKAHHERLAVPYFYVEWRAALRALGLTSERHAHPSPMLPPGRE
jgi:Fe-S-cluster containining protein